MQHPLLISLALGTALIAPVAAQTPAAPTAPARPINHAGGQVTAVNGGAITVMGRRNAGPVTFTLAPNAKVHRVVFGTASDLAVGNLVVVGGKISDDGKSVDARDIAVVAALPPGSGKQGGHPRYIAGTIATITPALTVTAADNTVVTVTGSAQTRVEQITAGSAGDITPGTFVNARLSGPDTALVASEVSVSPARPRGGNNNRNRNNRRKR